MNLKQENKTAEGISFGFRYSLLEDVEEIEEKARNNLKKLGINKMFEDKSIQEEILRQIMEKFKENRDRGISFTTTEGIIAETRRIFEKTKKGLIIDKKTIVANKKNVEQKIFDSVAEGNHNESLQEDAQDSNIKDMERVEEEKKTETTKATGSKIEQSNIGVEFITEGEKMRMGEEKERETRARESFKLSAEAEKNSSDILKENSDEIFRDLAEEYYNENEDFIKQEARVYNKDISREAKYDIVRNLGVFEQFKNKKGNWTEDQFEKFALAEGYDEMRAQLKSGKMSAEIPALILNSLEISKKEIQEKLDKKNMVGDNLDYALNGAARVDAIKRYNKIFSAQVELSEKIYGGSLIGDKEKNLLNKFNYAGQPLADLVARREIGREETRREFKEKIFRNDWNSLNNAEKMKHNDSFDRFVENKIGEQLNDTAKKYGINRDAVLALIRNGYSPENFYARGKSYKFGLGKKVYVGNGKEGLSKKEFREFVKNISKGFEEEIDAKVAEKISLENSDARDLFLGLKEKVSKFAFEPESAQKELAEAFGILKEKIINEVIVKSFKKEEKTREQLERIAKTLEGGNPVVAENLLKSLVSRKGKGLSELTDGDFDENFGHMKDFLDDFGIPTGGFEAMDAGKKTKFKEGYKKNAKSKTGFVKFMMDLAECFLGPNKK